MPAQPGRNNGVTGIIDFLPPNSTAPATIQVEILGFGQSLVAAQQVKLYGPGDGVVPTYYGTEVQGSFHCHGRVQSYQSPFPPTMQNLQGTVTLQADTGCTIKSPVLIGKMETEREKTSQDVWTVAIEATKNGPHTVVWNGSSVSYAQPSLANHELNEESFRVDDPNALSVSAEQHWFFPTPNYQDTASAALIATFIAGVTPPRPGLKVVTTRNTRIDDFATMLTLFWSFRDTKDEKQLPATHTLIDTSSLSSEATIGLIGNSSAGTTATLTGFTIRDYNIEKVTNPSNPTQASYLTTSVLGLLAKSEDITFPNTFILQDPSSLNTVAHATLIGNATTVTNYTASGLTVRSSKSTQLTSSLGTNNQFRGDFELGLRSTIQDRTFPGTFINQDPSSLNTTALTTVIGTNSSPTLSPSNLVVRSSKVVRLTATLGAGDQYEGTFEQGLRSTAEDRTLPGTFMVNDTNGLFTEAVVTVVSSNSSPAFSMPAAFGTASGLVVVSTKTEQLTSALGSNNQYETKWNLGLRSTADKILLPLVSSTRTPNEFVDMSPQIYNDTRQAADLASALYTQYQGSKSSSGGFLRKVHVYPHVNGKLVVIFEYVNPGVRVKGKTKSGASLIECQMSGTNPQLYVTSNIAYGIARNGTNSNSRRLLVLSRQRSHSTITRDFVIFREVQGTQVPDSPPATINGVTLPTPGHINGSTFLGLSAGTVKYVGASYDLNISLFTNGTLNMMMGYEFRYVSSGIIDFVPQSIFLRRFAQQVTAAGTNSGWVNASDLGIPGIVQPQTDSFAAFLA